MLKDLFVWLAEFCTNKSGIMPQVLVPRIGNRKSLYWDKANQKEMVVENGEPDRRHQALSLGSLMNYAKEHVSKDTKTNIWVGDKSIILEVEEGSDFAIIEMALKKNPIFARCESLLREPSVPQHEAIRLMRNQFAGAPNALQVETSVRNIKINTDSSFEAEESAQTAKLGKSVLQKAAGAGELPEVMDVFTTVWLGSEAQEQIIPVNLGIDFKKPGHVLFEPNETAMFNAVLIERASIVSTIENVLGDSVHVYEGEYRVVG